jgi:hypothetical protein
MGQGPWGRRPTILVRLDCVPALAARAGRTLRRPARTESQKPPLGESITRGTIGCRSKVRGPTSEIRLRRGTKVQSVSPRSKIRRRRVQSRRSAEGGPKTRGKSARWLERRFPLTPNPSPARGEGSLKSPHPAPSPSGLGEGERAATQMRNNTDQKGGRFCHLISEDSGTPERDWPVGIGSPPGTKFGFPPVMGTRFH